MKRRLSFLALFLALCVLALARWIVDGLRWARTLGGPRSRDPLVARAAP